MTQKTEPVTHQRIGSLMQQMGIIFAEKAPDTFFVFIPPVLMIVRVVGEGHFLSVNAQYNRSASIGVRPQLEAMCDQVNTNQLIPKAYTSVDDDGIVGLFAETSLIAISGLTDDQCRAFIDDSFSAILSFFHDVSATFPDTSLWPEGHSL